ncbi:MAG: hypothetical protein K2F99_08845 [Muribaculaceae bacterium]|nr:hypothetical protein [Muribaculaceae bacterium]
MAIDNKDHRSVEDRLKTLYELQTILSEKDRIREVRGELPKEVEDLGNTIKGLYSRVDRYQGEVGELNHARAIQENTIEHKKLMIETYRQQIDQVRNNHEFDKLTEQIESETLEIELCKKNISNLNEQIKVKQNDIEDTKQRIATLEQLLQEKSDDLDKLISETRAEEEALTIRAKGLESLIDDRTLNAFKRIRRNAKNGLGIVTVDREACGGCFNRIPPQRQIEVKLRKKVVVCEYCGRIMVDPTLAAEAQAEIDKQK